MLALIRVVLLVVLFFLLLSTVVAVASQETGVLEKAVLAALAAVLVWLASLVRRLGGGSLPRAG